MAKSEKPIQEHINDFLDWLDIEKGLSVKTQQNYHNFLKRFFSWLSSQKLQGLLPHELSLDHIRQYRLHLSRGLSLKKSSQNYYLIAIRSLLQYFSERNINSLPPDKVKLAREKEDSQVRFLTLEQLKKLWEAPDTSTLHGLRDRAMLETFFSTGLRIAELISLNREQIAFPANLDEELEISIQGKGGRIRTIYFSKRTLEWLQRYLKERTDNHEALFITYRSEEKKKDPRRISPRLIQELMKRYAIKAGLSPDLLTPHVMRHSFATFLLSKGVDIRTLQEFLGHKNIAATQIYAHLTSKQLREIHKKHLGSSELS
ncbi:MAG: tyrosine-type recombinase/integrase [Candidatus Wildermuthbacteria bacterium]|nr:tyrosine-type recombinase/integrase [Candidatus Wildermuthbacteria bacterium]